jgi:hypothetical protein
LEMKLEVLNHFDRDEGASCIWRVKGLILQWEPFMIKLW